MPNIETDDEFDYIFHIENPAFQGKKSKISLCGIGNFQTNRHFFSLEDAYLEQFRKGRMIPCEKCLKSLVKTMSVAYE